MPNARGLCLSPWSWNPCQELYTAKSVIRNVIRNRVQTTYRTVGLPIKESRELLHAIADYREKISKLEVIRRGLTGHAIPNLREEEIRLKVLRRGWGGKLFQASGRRNRCPPLRQCNVNFQCCSHQTCKQHTNRIVSTQMSMVLNAYAGPSAVSHFPSWG